MSGDTIQKPMEERTVTYTPLGSSEPLTLTIAMVRRFLTVPTKSGQLPTDEQVVKYMMLCKAQSLDPWQSDAFLTGYDTKDGPQFSLITAHQAFLKRAEASPEYDGIESGVIVAKGDTITERQGDLVLNGELIVGGWARVHRRDRRIPSYDALNRATFDTGYSRWKADPAGMIVKCAEASALRKAFPSTLAAMYCREEMDRVAEAHVDARPKTDRLAERFGVAPRLEQSDVTPLPIQNLTGQTMPDDRRECVKTAERPNLRPEGQERGSSDPEASSGEIPQKSMNELLQAIEHATTSDQVTDIAFCRRHLSETEQTVVEAAGRARKDVLRGAKP